MKPLAPEFRALMTILRLVGPVISTRRSCSASGTGATREVLRSRDEFELLTRIQPGLELLARVEQLSTAPVQLLVEPAHQREGFVCECFLARGFDVHQVLVSFL